MSPAQFVIIAVIAVGLIVAPVQLLALVAFAVGFVILCAFLEWAFHRNDGP